MAMAELGPLRSTRAGREGPEVRSDLCVTFEPDAPELEVVIHSRVAAYYGHALRQQVLALLAGLGVERGRLSVVDAGAVPFVIAARVECAVRKARPEARLADPSATFVCAPGAGAARAMGASSARMAAAATAPARAEATAWGTGQRLRRSRLYLPGAEPKYMLNAGLHGADGLILDLEDSVHPEEKDASRLLVRNALLALDFGAAERMVRINQLPLGLADLEEIVPARPDLILVPKVESAAQILEVDAAIGRILAHREQGGTGAAGAPGAVGRSGSGREGIARGDALHQGGILLMPILESALGLENAFAIASASPRIVALTIGLEDYTADLGVAKTPEGTETAWARNRLVNAAKAAGVQAIDSVYGDVEDLAGLASWARSARALGFEGMGCVHPRQIPVIHEGFAPSAAEIAKARRIVEAFEQAEAQGLGVVSLGSKMIDAPVVQRALRLVARARAMGLVEVER